MTQFVVSLFLPYTIDFKHEHTDPGLAVLPSPSAESAGSTSLVTELEHVQEKKELLFPAVANSSPSLHFTQPHDPRALVRTDSHAPEWGRPHVFNQPHWPIRILPPYTVLPSSSPQAKLHSEAPTVKMPSSLPGVDFTNPGWRVVPASRGNGGLKNAIHAAAKDRILPNKSCIGTLGFPTDALNQPTRNEIKQTLEAEFDACPVFVGDGDFHGHYNSYCKSILWPILHYQVPDHPTSKAYEDHSWIYYSKVNEYFADQIVQNYKHGDSIWIHDYHLMLLPGLLRERIPDAPIGFFFHVSFPSSEIFRCLAQRKQLLKGILGANLVVLQSQEYVHHFLQTCSHLLVIEATHKGVQLNDRFVDVACSPMGVIPEQIMAARETLDVLEWKQRIEHKYKDQKILVSRAKLEGTRGIKQTLLAYELFLHQHPKWVGHVVLVQIATPASRSPVELEGDLSEIIRRIDEQFSTLTYQPVHFLRQEIKFSQYMALLSSADAFLVMALRDGLNLTCHEYVLCQDGKMADTTKKFGSLILSEFTGSAAKFAGAEITVNPWDVQQSTEAIHKALLNCEKESQRKIRYQRMLNIVLQHNGLTWIEKLNDLLKASYTAQMKQSIMFVPRLSMPQLHEKYRAANTRLFILDFEHTLGSWEISDDAALDAPKPDLAVLQRLISLGNVVYIMSGRTPDELDRYFWSIPGIGLIAESGSFVRLFDDTAAPVEWLDLADSARNAAWKDNVKKVLAYYEERIEGSWIEERNCSLILHYENANHHQEVQAARRQAGDCANHLNHVCHNLSIKATPAEKSVVVALKDHDKTTACIKLLGLERMRIGRHRHEHTMGEHTSSHAFASDFPEFLMVAGNDRDDEAVFEWANSLEQNGSVSDAVTVHVGHRHSTCAKFTLTHGTTGLLSTLDRLSKP